MSYRDDLAAAASRAEAAERELARARADDKADKERIDAMARQLASSRQELNRLRARLSELDPEQPEPSEQPESVAPPAPPASPASVDREPAFRAAVAIAHAGRRARADVWSIVLPSVIGIGLIVGFVFLLAKGANEEKHARGQCKVTSEPESARIYRVYRSSEVMLGRAPLTLKAEDWLVLSLSNEPPTFEARLEGFQPTPIDPPAGGRCSTPIVVKLARH